MATVNIDIWSLFIALLVTALLQEFAIKPSVGVIRKYYHKSKKHVENMLLGNEETISAEGLMKK